MMRSDPMGELDWIGGAIGGISAGVASYVAGDSWWEICLSTVVGFVSGAAEGSLKLAINVFDATLAAGVLWVDGGGFFAGLANGAMTFASSYVSIDNFCKLVDISIAKESEYFLDAVFGGMNDILVEQGENEIQEGVPQSVNPNTSGGRRSGNRHTTSNIGNASTRIEIRCNAYL